MEDQPIGDQDHLLDAGILGVPLRALKERTVQDEEWLPMGRGYLPWWPRIYGCGAINN